MSELLNRYKKQCIIVSIILAVVLIVIYLRALFLPGMWYRDAFLYRQEDGSFSGSDFYAEYKMVIAHTDYGTDIQFSVNDKTNNYQIKYDENDFNRNVEIAENGNTTFNGTAYGSVDSWVLLDENHEMPDGITVRTSNDIPSEDELFPGYSTLYRWSVSDKTDTRGEPYMLFFIFLLGIILFLDIKIPNLFWILEHRLEVDGGEPSDWYRFGQKVGYVVMPLGILVCMIMTFTVR